MKKVLTLGSGFVSAHLNYAIFPGRIEFDEKYISDMLDKYKPDVIVNCIGKTGRPNIDWCELHKGETVLANTALPIMLASVCERKSIHLVQVGSGCIFFGDSPRVERAGYEQTVEKDYGWKEDDFANPQSFYSKTKYACDLAIGEMSNVSILRIRMPISTEDHPRNLINKLKSYSQVIDIQNSVTFMDDFAKCVTQVIDKGLVGIYHVTNPGSLSAAQIMTEYKKYFTNHKFETISIEQLSKLTLAKRSNCLLNTGKLKSVGIELPPANEALVSCMKKYAKN